MFLAQVDRFLEFLLPPLINLIQNSAKVIKAPKTILAFLFDPIIDRLWPQVVLSVCGSSFRTHLGEQCSLNIKNFINCPLLEYWLTSNLSPRFLPIICQHVSSKSKEIRRHTCEFLDQVIISNSNLQIWIQVHFQPIQSQLLHSWPTHSLEKHVAILQEVHTVTLRKALLTSETTGNQEGCEWCWPRRKNFCEKGEIFTQRVKF